MEMARETRYLIPDNVCVYTALVGAYQALNEQPIANKSGIPFICFTDDPHLQSDTWEVRQISCLFNDDFIRSQRVIKSRPQKYLSEFEASLYIDNTVILTERPEAVFQKYFPKSGLALPEHSFRETVLDEFLQVYSEGLDEHGRILEQLNHYALSCPKILSEKPYWCGVQLRDHRSARVTELLDLWMSHVLRYSRRDQLSLNFVMHQLNFAPDIIDIDNYTSWFHKWPVPEVRRRDVGLRLPLASLSPPIARARMLEVEVQKVTNERDAQAAQIQELKNEIERLNVEIRFQIKSRRYFGSKGRIATLAKRVRRLFRVF